MKPIRDDDLPSTGALATFCLQASVAGKGMKPLRFAPCPIPMALQDEVGVGTGVGAGVGVGVGAGVGAGLDFLQVRYGGEVEVGVWATASDAEKTKRVTADTTLFIGRALTQAESGAGYTI